METPDTEVPAKAHRRRFTAEYKQKIRPRSLWLCCSRIWASRRRTRGPTSRTTTRSPRATSRPSTTGPASPTSFGAPEDARGFSQDFFHWYNFEHHHSGLGLLTPADVHFGRAPARVAARGRVLEAAYAEHPERFVGGLPQPASVPTAVWINKPQQPEKESCMPCTLNSTKGCLKVVDAHRAVFAATGPLRLPEVERPMVPPAAQLGRLH